MPQNDDAHWLREPDAADRFAWRARIRANPTLRFWYRIGVGLAGALLMLAAGFTGWLPGPGGIPLFLLGLAVWASEFDWAHGVLQHVTGWFDRLRDLTPAQRRLGVVLTLVGIVATWYVAAALTGVPGWLPDAVEHRLRRLPGLE